MPNIRKGESVTLANTTAVEYVPQQANQGAEIIIRTNPSNSGTIQFAVTVENSTASFTNAYAYPADKVLFLTVGRNESIYAKASAGGQSFSAEY